MNIPENLLNNPIVKREVKPAITVQPTELPVETIEGLPFYYYFDIKFASLLIGIGIILFIFNILIGIGIFIIPYLVKKFICTKCKKIIYKRTNPQKCSVCGGIVVPIKEYSPETTKINDTTYAICPTCNSKYKVTKDESGATKIFDLIDVKSNKKGLQIFCPHCRTKLTIAELEE